MRCPFTPTCCWKCTMSMRFWAPGERLVPISSTRHCTCCMSMPGPRAKLGCSCWSPTMTRHTKTLLLPARDSSWGTDQRGQYVAYVPSRRQRFITLISPSALCVWTEVSECNSPWPHRLRMDARGAAVSCRKVLCLNCEQRREETVLQHPIRHSSNSDFTRH